VGISICTRNPQLTNLDRYVTFFAWSLANWITFQPLILVHNKDDKTLQFIVNVLFALFLCSAILMGEKFAIQWIAGKFHEKSYAGRRLSSAYMSSQLI
jgi:hypothetical protein